MLLLSNVLLLVCTVDGSAVDGSLKAPGSTESKVLACNSYDTIPFRQNGGLTLGPIAIVLKRLLRNALHSTTASFFNTMELQCLVMLVTPSIQPQAVPYVAAASNVWHACGPPAKTGSPRLYRCMCSVLCWQGTYLWGSCRGT